MDTPPIPAEPAALFLDFDGTLVEIAERPDAVVVPPDLPALLTRLAHRLGGALAVVSGRSLAELDHFLPRAIAKAGNHGAMLRRAADAPVEAPDLPVPPEAWRRRAETLVQTFPGALVEHKRHGFALHYRQAPEASAAARALLEHLLREAPDQFHLLPARMAWEVTPRGVTKGTAVASFLARAPFAGRKPVFIGDDVTDEAGMAVARAAGGLGLRLQDSFGTPEGLRHWLTEWEARA